VALSGKARLAQNGQEVNFYDGTFTTDLGLVNVDRLQEVFPEMKSAGLQKPLKGQSKVTIERFAASGQGLGDLALQGTLRDGQIALAAVPVPVREIKADFQMTKEVLTISDFSAGLSSGNVAIKGRIENYMTHPESAFDVAIQRLPLGELLPPFEKEVRFSGLMNGQAHLRFQGFDPQQLGQSLSGPVHLQVDDGKLENLNILRLVLERMSIIPDLVDKIYVNLPEKYRDQLQRNETVFEQISSDLTADKGTLVIEDSRVVADTFTAEAEGRLDPQMNINLSAALSIPEDLSLSMIRSVAELQYIAAEDGRIVISFQRYQGPISAFRIMPDMEYLTKRILVNRGGQEIERLLDKVFGAEGQAPSEGAPAPQGQEGQESQQPQKPPERQIIENLLDSIFQ